MKVFDKMRALKPVANCDTSIAGTLPRGDEPPPAHGVKWSIDSHMYYLEGRVAGLNVEDFD